MAVILGRRRIVFTFVVLAMSTLSVPVISDLETPKVLTSLGPVVGEYRQSQQERTYAAFEGVPYAKPPIDRRRFEPPEPVPGWTKTLNATKFRSICTQYVHDRTNKPPYPSLGDEDCLYLNVYVPVTNIKTQPLPVVFFIHGGAFQFGSGSWYGPKYLMDRDVILVTFNYRLGPLGFLSTEDSIVPGNMGLKDQIAALDWVNQHIASFGGDPNKVQLNGFSAGATSVHFHYLSPLSKGKFATGVSFDGVALNCWTMTEGAREKAQKLGSILDCPTEDSRAMVDCLKGKPAKEIIEATKEFQPWLYNPYTPFGPVVEKESSKPFLDRSPIEIIAKGEAADKPWVTGFTTEEGLYPLAEIITKPHLLKELDENWDRIAPHLLDFNYTIPLNKHKNVARKIRQYYFGGQHISNYTISSLTYLVGDRLFYQYAEDTVRLQASKTKSPVYIFVYGYRANESFSQYLSYSDEDFGVSHCDEITLVFESTLVHPKSREDFVMQNKFLDFTVSFAKTGVPDFGVEWDQVDPKAKELEFLRLDNPAKIYMDSSNDLGHKTFWKSIDFDENKLKDSELLGDIPQCRHDESIE